DAAFAEGPDEREGDAEVEADHGGGDLDGRDGVFLGVEGADLDLVGAVAPEAGRVEDRDPRGAVGLDGPELVAVLEEEGDDGAGEDHEADGGGDGEEEDEAEGFLEDVLEVFLRRGEEGEDDGGDGVADEGEGELGELVAVVEDRDGAVAGDEVLGDKAADELVDLDGGEAEDERQRLAEDVAEDGVAGIGVGARSHAAAEERDGEEED